jgi:hypothetical protein
MESRTQEKFMNHAILAGLFALCFGTSVPAVDSPSEADSPEHLLLIFAGQTHMVGQGNTSHPQKI